MFVLGGFIIVREAARAAYMNAEIVPPRLLSASECLVPTAPGTWGIDWATATRESRLEELRKFDLADDRLDDLIAWSSSKFDRGLGWPGVFTDLVTAQEFVQRFVPNNHDARLIALCISAADVDEFLAAASPGAQTAEFAALTLVRRRGPPPAGGVELGTDVLGVELSGSFHSFLCNTLETPIREHLGALPNTLGLYDDHDIGRRAAEFIESSGGAEPVPWFAWRLLEYPRA